MSLRVRLNLLLSVLFVTILVLGTVLVIGNARRAVLEETESTARLTLQLLELAYDAADPVGVAALQDRLREQLGALEAARHLQVLLVEGGRELELRGVRAEPVAAPSWFVRLVEPGDDRAAPAVSRRRARQRRDRRARGSGRRDRGILGGRAPACCC